jgi:hypothetical protein
MDIDQEKLEHTVLALLYLTSFKDRFGVREGARLGSNEPLARERLHLESGYQSQVCRIHRRRGSAVERAV